MSSGIHKNEAKKRFAQQVAEQETLRRVIRDQREKTTVSLRFNRPWVSASILAGQYFCEKKVEMRFLHGEVDTEAKQLGSEAHDQLLAQSVKVEREDILRRIYAGETVIAQEMLIFSRYRDLILAGKPDAVVFHETRPLFVFEYKFSTSPIPYKSYHTQAKVYGTILEGMGFDTRQLHYVIAVVPLQCRDDAALFTNVFEVVVKNGPKEATIALGEANIYIHQYHPVDAQVDIDWTLDYWRGTREAIPTRNPNKCRSCEYLDQCDVSVNVR